MSRKFELAYFFYQVKPILTECLINGSTGYFRPVSRYSYLGQSRHHITNSGSVVHASQVANSLCE